MRAIFFLLRATFIRFTALSLAGILAGCGTTHPLPKYERPLARTTFQTVRTTAYTHTESDHLEFGNHNALGGTLHAAGPPVGAVPRAVPVATAITPFAPDPMLAPPPSSTMAATGGVYGSAAADWSRWPAGTIFRIIPTGQLYKVDDYGWALSGRNTIDLYMPTRATMNAWGVREEQIQILQWGDRDESLRRLTRHQKYRHIRRMVLELEGKTRAAAAMR